MTRQGHRRLYTTAEGALARRPPVTDVQRATVRYWLEQEGMLSFPMLVHRCAVGHMVRIGLTTVHGSQNRHQLARVGQLDAGDTRRTLQSMISRGEVESFLAPRFTRARALRKHQWPKAKRPMTVYQLAS